MPIEVTFETLSQYLIIPLVLIITGGCVRICRYEYKNKNQRRDQQNLHPIQRPAIEHQMNPVAETIVVIEEAAHVSKQIAEIMNNVQSPIEEVTQIWALASTYLDTEYDSSEDDKDVPPIEYYEDTTTLSEFFSAEQDFYPELGCKVPPNTPDDSSYDYYTDEI